MLAQTRAEFSILHEYVEAFRPNLPLQHLLTTVLTWVPPGSRVPQ